MDWILLIVPGVIWGASFLFIAEGLEAMAPNGVTFTRILVGFVTLALFSGSRRPIRREDWPGTALVGVLWMAFPLSMFPYAERHVSSAITGMLNGACRCSSRSSPRASPANGRRGASPSGSRSGWLGAC